MKRTIAIILAAVLILTALAACAAEPKADESAPQESEITLYAPEAKSGTLQSFAAVDIEGAEFDETVFAGHRLNMINVWATYCGPCLNEMPGLQALSESYKAEDFQLVGIVSDVSADSDGLYSSDDVKLARELRDMTGADFTHLLPSADLVNAVLGGVSAVPTTIFVDETGAQIGEAYVGARSEDAWANIVDGLLEDMK